MLNILRCFSLGCMMLTIMFPIYAFSWNPLGWVIGEKKEVNPVQSVKPLISMEKKDVQHVQKNGYDEYYEKVHTLGKQGILKVSEHAQWALNSVQRHPLPTVGLIGVAASAYVWYYLAVLRTQLQKKETAWALWQAERVMDIRAKTSLRDELLHEIQVRYIDIRNVVDFMGPIERFMIDIDKEIYRLQLYAFYVSTLHTMGLQGYLDIPLYEEIDQRIYRLQYLKNLCLDWLSEAKLNYKVKIPSNG